MTPAKVAPRRRPKSQQNGGGHSAPMIKQVPAAIFQHSSIGAPKLPAEVLSVLTKLDDRLVEALKRGDVCLVRSAWLLEQPPGFRMPMRQDLEKFDVSPSPLLDPEEAVALVRRGDRSAGILSYGWVSHRSPDPAGARVQVVRAALEQLPYIEGVFWE